MKVKINIKAFTIITVGPTGVFKLNESSNPTIPETKENNTEKK